MSVAHQGGWDEMLLIAVPLLLVAGLLALAKRRVDRQAGSGGAPQPGDRPDPPVGPPG